jgi:hypothetical protein
MAAQTVIKLRRDTAANWTSTNPILAAGEQGFETDTGKIKIGNGSTTWTLLSYSNPGGAVPQSQVTNLTTDLSAKAPLANPTFTGTVTTAALNVTGNLTVGGTTTTVNATDLVVEDPLIYIGEGNNANVVDLGVVSSFNDGTYQHSGLVRDASDNKWKLFKGVIDEPTTTVNFAQGSLDALAVGSLEVGSVSNTEIGYLDGVTSAIQTQLNGKASTSGTLAQFASTTSSELASIISNETGSGALVFGTSPTITTPTINYGTLVMATVRSLKETSSVVASAATGVINYDVSTSTDWYYTSNATANFTLNFRQSSGVTLNNSLGIGDTVTCVFRNTNGTTPYYPNVIQIDGTNVTPKWLGGTAPSAGNASSIDVYSFVITKTANATFTVLGSVSKFA